MGVIKEGNGGRGKERRNGPWSDENISSGEKSNAAFGRGRGFAQDLGEGGGLGWGGVGSGKKSALVHVQYI